MLKKIILSLLIVLSIGASSFADDQFGSMWVQEDTTLRPADDIAFVNLTGAGGATVWGGGGSGGTVIQVVNVQDGEVATGTTLLADDDTIPQNTEGDEYMTLTITPTSATNKIKTDVVIHLAHSASTGNILTAALFQDNIAPAIAVGWGGRDVGSNTRTQIKFTHYTTAATTSPITHKVRAGSSVAGTTTFNGRAGTRLYGGRVSSSITITEIEP